MAKTVPAEMPFLDHLEELRVRLMWSLGALVIGVAVGVFVVIKFDVVRLLEKPILPYLKGHLIVTHPADAFKIVMMVALAVGVIIALPVILYQIWAFLSPALYQHEKRVVMPVLVFATLLFAGGILFSWYVVLPATLGFLLTFQAAAFDSFIRAEEYFSFATSISLALGAVFELPVVILLLTALGILTPKFLHTYRRHAFVLCVVVAAFITPGGDPLSLTLLTAPLYLLFEVSVVLSEIVYRRRLRKEAAAAKAEALEAAREAEAAELERAREEEALR